MKINIKYSGKIINLPSTVADFASEASKEELAVIIGIFSDIEVLSCFDEYISAFSERLGIGVERVQRALKFWRDKGVIEIEGMDESQLISSSSSVPTYTGAQIAKFVEKNEDIHSLFASCQAILGKEFNTSDHNHIIFLRDFYKFSDQYILLLLSYCKDIGKKNWSYIRTMAQSLYDDGIDTYTKLEAHFSKRKDSSSFEYRVRNLFGIGNREFSKKESQTIQRWIDLEIDFELLRVAFNINVDKKSTPSLAYCAKIIENWIYSGIKTVKAAEKTIKKEKESSDSFDIKQAYEAALRRSYPTKGDK